MYEKNLNKSVRLRLSEDDFNYLVDLSDKMDISVSEVIRLIIRTSKYISNKGADVYGDTETDFDNII